MRLMIRVWLPSKGVWFVDAIGLVCKQNLNSFTFSFASIY